MLLISHPQTYPNERSYALDLTLGEFLGLAWEGRPQARRDIEITMRDLPDGPGLLLPDSLFSTPARDWLTERSLPRTPLAQWQLAQTPSALAALGDTATAALGDSIPVIYGEPLADGSFYGERPGGIALGLDVFGSVFFQLTRYEELARPVADEHGRFPANASLALREGFLSRPLVNEYVELLWSALSRLFPRLQRAQRSARELLSHDVDWPLMKSTPTSRILKAAAGDLVRRREPARAAGRLRGAAARLRDDPRIDPYNTFELIMDWSERHGLCSAFYFMAGVTEPRFDGTYSLADPWIGRLIRRIHERGHEIGLHTSYGTYRDPDATRREREQLLALCERLGVSQPQWGGRQHFLRWENPTTWRNWEHAEMTYDSSLGFSHDPGFRCGTCHEYPVYDLLARRRLRLRERPLVVMESSLIDRPDTSGAEALETIAELRAQCRRFAGDFTLLWHNSRLLSPRERELYARALPPIPGSP
jgi:hypothetical protein